MTATHNDIIDVNILLEAAPVPQAGFGRVLFLATDLSLGGGDTFRVYESTKAVNNDTDLSAAQKKALNTALAQVPNPEAVVVAPHDEAGGATYSESLAAAEAGGAAFYGVTIESRVASDINEASEAVQTGGKYLFFAQSTAAADGNIYDALATFDGMNANERTVLLYHDDNAEFLDVGYAASRLVFDPDAQSAAWQGRVRAVAPYASFTDAQEAAAEADNVNLMLPLGPYPSYVSAGVNVAGRAIEELVTADWFKARLEERFIQLKVNYDDRGIKIPLSPTGQNIVRGELETQFQIGVTAGHFLADPAPSVTFPDPIPDSDIQSRTLRASASAQFASNAAEFVMNINLTRV